MMIREIVYFSFCTKEKNIIIFIFFIVVFVVCDLYAK